MFRMKQILMQGTHNKKKSTASRPPTGLGRESDFQFPIPLHGEVVYAQLHGKIRQNLWFFGFLKVVVKEFWI